MTTQSEQALENGLIKTLQSLNYKYIAIEDETALIANFREQLQIHNHTVFTDDEFRRIMIHLESGSTFVKAEKLRDRFSLEREDGTTAWVRFLNTKDWCKNEFQISNQIADEARRRCRYDVTILVNGLPLVQVELKKRGVELKQAYNQVQRYHKTAFKGLFHYIQIFVISNGVNTRYFANNPNQGYKFTFPWADAKNNHIDRLDLFAAMFFEQCTLGKILAKYVVLHKSDKCLMVLRPYQYYAVEKILDRIVNSNQNGYIWHTTGSGKTLTSFKTAELIAEIPEIDKVLFVVDRHDLDTQTKKEYDSFSPGAVDSTDDTRALVKSLCKNETKLILTTIQKLNHAVQKARYSKDLKTVKDKNIIMIFDECHRSQFGDMHTNITEFFTNIRYFGFTGTPIFADNANKKRTTKDIFGERLHEYLIKDAIADENVLGFLVEYYGKWNRKTNKDAQVKAIDTKEAFEDEKRMRDIARFVVGNIDGSTYNRDFNAIFAVSNIPTLLRYYDLFKEFNQDLKIATIFTYIQNEETEDDLTGLNQGFVDDITTRDKLEAIIKEYNIQHDTEFSTDNFSLYYDDIGNRMKNKQIDLLLVVNMFLTGFDAKRLNTLYVDKNLNYHGLIQAFSRTNRVLNEKKKFGKIVCFRDLKSNVDAALRLYSDNQSPEEVLMEPYKELVDAFNEQAVIFLSNFPNLKVVGELQSEADKRKFVVMFRALLRLMTQLRGYNEFDSEDLSVDQQRFADYQSKYLDMSNGFAVKGDPDTEVESIVQDIDFELELIHRDVVNVMYIIALLQDLKPESKSYFKDRKAILDVMEGDPILCSKVKLIDEFIRIHIDGKETGELPEDMETDLDKYITAERRKVLEALATEEGVSPDKLEEYITEMEYLGRPKNDIIKEAVKPLELPFRERRAKEKGIIEKLKDIIKMFSWN